MFCAVLHLLKLHMILCPKIMYSVPWCCRQMAGIDKYSIEMTKSIITAIISDEYIVFLHYF